MGRTVRSILAEIEDCKKVIEKLSVHPGEAKCQEDVERVIKAQLEYGDLIAIKGLIEYRIHELLEMEVLDGNVD